MLNSRRRSRKPVAPLSVPPVASGEVIDAAWGNAVSSSIASLEGKFRGPLPYSPGVACSSGALQLDDISIR